MSFRYNQVDSLKSGQMQVMIHFYDLLTSNDSTIYEFKYSIRTGDEYLVREESFEKIGMIIPQRTFLTLDGESIQIGGDQTKPILLNLWFVGCRGCEEEMPSLNKLKEKYGDRVNIVSMTFDDERVIKFLKKKAFNFKHIVNVDPDYIGQIGTSPYPENIFISKEGEIKNIEGGLSNDNEQKLKYFESLVQKLL